MKSKACLIVLSMMLVFACQQLTVNSELSSERNTGQSADLATTKDDSEKIWIPDVIEKCISKAKAPEPIEIESSFNPYYLRLNFDGNQTFDLAILVHSVQEKNSRGLLICKDSEIPFLFGKVSKSKEPFSDIDGDNFVTNDWEVLSKGDTGLVTKNSDGGKVGNDTKGESVGFFLEGGSFFVYWDGKKFKGVGGV